jgi:hypothetical protein
MRLSKNKNYTLRKRRKTKSKLDGLRKTLSNLYSMIYPKPDRGEYNTKELIGWFIVFGGLIALLIYSCIHSFFQLFPK